MLPKWRTKAKIDFIGGSVAGKAWFKAINGLIEQGLVGRARNKAGNGVKVALKGGDTRDKAENGLKLTKMHPKWRNKAKIGFIGIKVAGSDSFKAIKGLKATGEVEEHFYLLLQYTKTIAAARQTTLIYASRSAHIPTNHITTASQPTVQQVTLPY